MNVAGYLSLAFAVAVLVLEGASVGVGIRLWRQRKRPGASRVGPTLGAVVGGTLFILVTTAVVGSITTLTAAFTAVNGESADPSQKARILAQGISEAMNYTALAMFVALPLSIGLLVYAFVRDRRNRAATR